MRPMVILTNAGVTKSEFSRLSGFSRVSLNRWIDEGGTPHRRVNRVYYEGLLEAIRLATTQRKLPLPEGLSCAERDRRIKAAVREHFDIESIELLTA